MPILQMRKLRPERATPGGGSQDGDAALQTWRPVAVLLKSQAGLGQDRIQRLSLVLIGLTPREITDCIFMSSNPVCIPGLTSYSSSPLSPVAYIIFLLSLLTSSSPPLTSELCFPEHPPLVQSTCLLNPTSLSCTPKPRKEELGEKEDRTELSLHRA